MVFRFWPATWSPLYLTYHPDSHWVWSAHPEFEDLRDRFVDRNTLNNGGDTTRLWSFILNIKQLLSEGIPGDFAELGVWRGNTAAVLAYYAGMGSRAVFLFDTFEGFHKRDLTSVDADKARAFTDTSLDLARQIIGKSFTHCRFVKGYFPDSITQQAKDRTYAVVSLDCDLYEPMRAGLEFFYPRMSDGGIFFLHDYSSLQWDGAAKAISEFCRERNEYLILCPDKSGSAFFRKSKR